MRKYVLLLLPFLLVCHVSGQERNPTASRVAFEKIDQIILQYEEWSSFKELGKDTISNRVVDDFITLFDSSANVYDGINLRKDSAGFFLFPLVTGHKGVNVFVQESRTNFPAGFRMNISKANIDYSEMASGKVKVIAERVLSGKTKSMSASGLKEYFIQASDTVEIALTIVGNPTVVKIGSITMRGSLVKCPECEKETLDEMKRREKNAIKKEKEPDVKVIKPVKPPKPEKQKSPTSFDLALQPFFGFGSANMALNQLSKTNLDAEVYTGMIESKSQLSGLKSTGFNTVYSAGVNLEFMFGKKTQVGFATGINLQFVNMDVTLDKYKVEYKGTDASGTTYNRIVSAQNIEEKVKVRSTIIPVLLRMSLGKGNSVHWHFGAGPVLGIKSTLTSDATASGNFEAVYHRAQSGFEFDPTGVVGANDWDMTYATVSSRMGDANAQTYFANHKAAGFDIAYNKAYNEKSEDYSYNIKAAWMITAAAGWHLGAKSELTVGLSYVASTLNRTGATKYAMFDKTSDKYKSLMETSSEIKNSTINLLVGIRFLLTEKNP